MTDLTPVRFGASLELKNSAARKPVDRKHLTSFDGGATSGDAFTFRQAPVRFGNGWNPSPGYTGDDPGLKPAGEDEDTKTAFLREVGDHIAQHTRLVSPDDEALSPCRDFKGMRPQQVEQLLETIDRNWLRHAFLTSDNPELVDGVLLGFYERLPEGVKVIEVDDINSLARQFRELASELDSDGSGTEFMFPGMPKPKKKPQAQEALRSLEQEFATQLYESFKQKYDLKKTDKVVLVAKDVELDGGPEQAKKLWDILEKLDIDLHVVATGKVPSPEELTNNPMAAMMPDFMKTIMGAMKDFMGKRFDNVQFITVPHIRAEEWPAILNKDSNAIGKAAGKIMRHHGFTFSSEAFTQFMGAVAVEYSEKPTMQDVLAELDQFGSFFNKTRQADQTEAAPEDIHRYVKTVLAKRNSMSDINPMEELGSMMVPNPFNVIKHSDVTFADIIGHGDAKEAIMDVLDPYNRLLYEAGKGSTHSNVTTVMLVGPPGTGKTELARAAAGEFNGTMIEANAAQLMNQYQASGSVNTNRLKKLVQTASSDVVVVFLDEIDAVGSREGGGISSEERRTLNSLLTTLQGAGKQFNKTVLFMFATNKPDALDDALLSRVERQIHVGPPSVGERKDIWQLHLQKANIQPSEDIDWDRLASLTNGRVGRDIFFMVKGIKKDLIRRMPVAEKQKIVSDPELLKSFNVPATQQDLERGIKLYDQEHQAGKPKGRMGFIPEPE